MSMTGEDITLYPIDHEQVAVRPVATEPLLAVVMMVPSHARDAPLTWEVLMMFIPTAARRLAALGLCVTATLTAPFAALPANAASGADFIITIDPATGGAYVMRLTCDPDGGIHPRPGAACGVLREVHGNVEALNVNPGPCPKDYAPVDVTVEGHWYERPVSYHNEFHNRCLMERVLGPVVGAR